MRAHCNRVGGLSYADARRDHRRVFAGLGIVRRRRQQTVRLARSAQLRLRQSRSDQRIAHRQQGCGRADPARRRRQGLCRGVGRQSPGRELGRCLARDRGCRAGRVPRSSVSGVPSFRRRQGRIDGGGHRARIVMAAGSGTRRHLADRRAGVSHVVARLARRRPGDATAGLLFPRLLARILGVGADRAADVLAPSRQYTQADCRRRAQDRREIGSERAVPRRRVLRPLQLLARNSGRARLESSHRGRTPKA
jgi:hypothetical protein